MANALIYHGSFDLNHERLTSRTTDYLDARGQRRPVPTAVFTGVRFAYMTKPGPTFWVVKAGPVVLKQPVKLQPRRHSDGKGYAPPPTLFEDESAARLLEDILRANPAQSDAILALQSKLAAAMNGPSADYVVYHHPGKNEPLSKPRGRYSIYTGKPVKGVNKDDRVWVITSTEEPRTYLLVEWFRASGTRTAMPNRENTVHGAIGEFFDPPIRIDQEDWFPAFLKNQGNFGRGFSPITDEQFVTGLELAASGGDKDRQGDSGGGQGFGDSETNRRVERAAVAVVTREYRRGGWAVRSVERARCGYDLECRRGGSLQCVEVKGISGSQCSFFLTSNELSHAKTNSNFVLVAVTNALTAPKSQIFSGAELIESFEFSPIAFRASMRDQRE